ncbi:MAG: DUF4199 family protein [Bacteroidia bacterium]
MEIKSELKFGFWMAFALFIWWIAEYLLGFQGEKMENLSLSINVSNLIVIVVGLYLSMTEKKNATDKADLKYGTLALSGGVALLAAAILILALTSIFYHFINTGWQEFVTNINLKEFATDLEGEDLQKKREMYMAMYAPGSMGMQNFARFTMYGFFIVLIEALIVLKLPSSARNK